MIIMKMIQNLIKKMKWYDIGLIKLAVFFATLMFIVAFPGFLAFIMQFDWYIYLILMIIFSIPSFLKLK
jgi:hypothetical protein